MGRRGRRREGLSPDRGSANLGVKQWSRLTTAGGQASARDYEYSILKTDHDPRRLQLEAQESQGCSANGQRLAKWALTPLLGADTRLQVGQAAI